MSPITTHILDTAQGRPAQGVTVILERELQGVWTELARGVTDADGRLRDLLPDGTPFVNGIYRLRFATGAYFHSQGLPSFYPEVQIVVRLEDTADHYHVPLLLSPYGYSTYRGS